MERLTESVLERLNTRTHAPALLLITLLALGIGLSSCGKDDVARNEAKDRASFAQHSQGTDRADSPETSPLTSGTPLSGSARRDSVPASSALDAFLDSAEKEATPEGLKILISGRAMITEGEIVVGSCWDYINAVYNRAGYPTGSRALSFRSQKAGPYVDLDLLQPGDWLYFVNHSFGGVEHSSIFIGWTERTKNEALMLSYAGGNRKSPARYKVYDLSSVYTIIRPRPED